MQPQLGACFITELVVGVGKPPWAKIWEPQPGHCYGLDGECPLEVSCVPSLGFWKVTASWGCCISEFIAEGAARRHSPVRRGKMLGCDLEVCTSLPGRPGGAAVLGTGPSATLFMPRSRLTVD